MTTQVTITMDTPHAAKIHIIRRNRETGAKTELAIIGPGESHVNHIWQGDDILLTEVLQHETET